MHTSQDPLGYGWTYLSDLTAGIQQYAAYRGEPMNTWSENVSAENQDTQWTKITSDIVGNHPMVFLVDTDGDGGTDHFVPVFGFEQRPDGSDWFAAYTTWSEDETSSWFKFQPMAQGTGWGVADVTFTEPQSANSLAHQSSGNALAMGIDSRVTLSQLHAPNVQIG